MTVDLDLNIGDLLAGIAALAVAVITIFTAANARARLHKVAQQSMELANSLNEQAKALPIDSPARSRAVGLYQELVFRSHYATQRYLNRTTPRVLTLIESGAQVLICILLASATWTLRGVSTEWETLRSLIAWALLVVAALIIVRSVVTSRGHAAVKSALSVKAKDFMEEVPEPTRLRWLALATGASISAATLASLLLRKSRK
jgi:hypothetical protein